jgi:hypothetical protein
MTKEFITNLLSNNESAIYKNVKKGTKSFRITQQLLQGIWYKAKRLKNLPILILTIPANKKENYVLRCQVMKEKK